MDERFDGTNVFFARSTSGPFDRWHGWGTTNGILHRWPQHAQLQNGTLVITHSETYTGPGRGPRYYQQARLKTLVCLPSLDALSAVNIPSGQGNLACVLDSGIPFEQ